ncbi:MAG: hypothetical protein HIU82_13665 [Proteobacteria bacterium]|nr:hypothetical protein [Pseudomonadota bacterium]
MNLPVALPAWLPWWASLVLLVAVVLWGLAFLLVPFSVIGVKARLEGLEARLDEIQGEIRTLALRLPERPSAIPFDEVYTIPNEASARAAPSAAVPRRPPSIVRPPIPPAAPDLRARPQEAEPPFSAPRQPRREPRVEPRVEPRFDRRP